VILRSRPSDSKGSTGSTAVACSSLSGTSLNSPEFLGHLRVSSSCAVRTRQATASRSSHACASPSSTRRWCVSPGLYKVEDAIRGSNPDRRRAVRQERSRPLVDEFFTWLAAQAKRVSRKSDLGEAMAYMLKRQDDGVDASLPYGIAMCQALDVETKQIEGGIRERSYHHWRRSGKERFPAPWRSGRWFGRVPE